MHDGDVSSNPFNRFLQTLISLQHRYPTMTAPTASHHFAYLTAQPPQPLTALGLPTPPLAQMGVNRAYQYITSTPTANFQFSDWDFGPIGRFHPPNTQFTTSSRIVHPYRSERSPSILQNAFLHQQPSPPPPLQSNPFLNEAHIHTFTNPIAPGNGMHLPTRLFHPQQQFQYYAAMPREVVSCGRDWLLSSKKFSI
jgi:hypothetical protein